MRLACVFVPRFPLAVERGRLGVGDQRRTDSIIYDKNKVAEASPELMEVWPGRALRQARALYPHALYIPADHARYAEAWAAMLRTLEEIAPEVEPASDGGLGCAYVGVAGLERMYGGGVCASDRATNCTDRSLDLSSSVGMNAPSWLNSTDGAFEADGSRKQQLQDRSKDLSVREQESFEHDDARTYEAIAHTLIDAVREATGLIASVAIASGKFVARVGAFLSKPGSVVVVPEGGERAFLRDASVGLLPFDPEIAQRLRSLSLDTIGAIAALPRPAVEAQFRAIGGRMWDLANGIDETPLIPRRTPEAISERLTFESPVVTSEALIMAARQVVRRLAVRLDHRAARKMHAQVLAEGHLVWERIETFRDATADETRMMTLLKTRLSSLQLTEAVDTVAITLSEIIREPGRQTKLITETNPQLERLLEAVHEIRARFGAPMVWRAVEVDPCSRHPEDRTILIPYDA